ncbi:MAG: hypothetical protein M0Z39_08475 [Actinomycetota bacterium]|jgi:hypothetical protein|nr:hypothetical protein [Actinomycetota bacterium]
MNPTETDSGALAAVLAGAAEEADADEEAGAEDPHAAATRAIDTVTAEDTTIFRPRRTPETMLLDRIRRSETLRLFKDRETITNT